MARVVRGRLTGPELAPLVNVIATPHVGRWIGRAVLQLPADKHDLFAAHVTDEDVGDYSVSEAGWYALDDGEKVVLGPFASLAECERNIRDRDRMTPKTV